MKHSLLILLFLLIGAMSAPSLAQSGRSIRGTVTSETGEGLPGVSIVVKGTQRGTTTDANGNFTLNVPDGNTVLTASFIGYVTQDIPVGNRTQLDFRMTTDTKSLNEVVIVGYVEQSRAKTTAAVSKLNTQELRSVPYTNPAQGLQGKMAGVSIPTASGAPGTSGQVIVRGGTKVNVYGIGTLGSPGAANNIQVGAGAGIIDNTQPLYVVDGVYRAAGLQDLNPDDIESLQVLKDAASTAAYGARGANGVVVVKTKSGKFGAGKANVTFRYQHAWDSQLRPVNYLSAREYLPLARRTLNANPDLNNANNLLNNGGFSAGTRTFTAPGQFNLSPYYTADLDNLTQVEGKPYVDRLLANGYETVEDPLRPGKQLLFKDNQLQDQLWNTAQLNNYTIGIDGGSDRVAYNVSMGYVDQGGIFLGTGYKRFSGLGNFQVRVSDKFRIDVNSQYQFNKTAVLDNQFIVLTRGSRLTPLVRTYYDSGLPAIGENVNTRIRLHELYFDDRRITTDRFTIRIAGDYEIVKGLHYRPAISLLTQNYRHLYQQDDFPGPIQYGDPRQKFNFVSDDKQFLTDQLLQYDLNAGKHTITALAGFNYTRNTNYGLFAQSSRASNNYVYTIAEPIVRNENGQVRPNFLNVNSSIFEVRSASYFGQVNYDFDGRYLLGASLRYDGFSNFAPSRKFAFFPSASAGWNIARESFWKVTPINTLKLRASYGVAGLNDLSITDTYGLFSANLYAQSVGILRSNLANPNLVWEQTQTIDAGLDIGLFNRLNLSIDVYDKLTKNRLDNFILPAESGFGSIRYNVGELRNRGIELEIGGTVLRKGDFAWNANFSFAYNQQMITKLSPNGRDKNRQGGAKIWDPATKKEIEVGGFAEGERPFGLWAFQSDGIFATDAEAKAWSDANKDLVAPAVAQSRGKRAGDVRWRDVNGDNIIDARDLVFQGYRTPDKIGGMQNTFSYRGLTLRFTMDYALGHVINNGALAREMGQGRAANEGAPTLAIGPDTWQKEGDAGKTYPRFSFADFDNGQRNHIRFAYAVGANDVGLGDAFGTDNSIYYSKGDFLAFRELSLAYELPKNLTQRVGTSGITLNAGIYNLGYLTAYKGRNPETYKGFDEGNIPRPRQVSVGATVRF